MRSYRKEIWFNTTTRRAYINITDKVQAAIDESGNANKSLRYQILKDSDLAEQTSAST